MTKSHSMNHRRAWNRRSTSLPRRGRANDPQVQLDFLLLTGNENGHKQSTVTVLVLVDRVSGGVCCADKQGCVGTISQFECGSLELWGHTDVTIRHDHEHALTQLVRERCGHSTYVELAPAARHQSVGAIERANQDVANQSRALKLSPEERLQRAIRTDHPCILWLVRHSGCVKRCSGESVCFAESVWAGARGDTDKADQLGTPWSEKIWQGKYETSDEHL